MLGSFKHLVGKKSKEETQLQAYKTSLEQDPNNVNIRLKLGDLYARLGDKKSAIQEYTTAAIQYADDGFLVKAIAVNKIIVRLDPSRQEALDRLSQLYFQRGIAADPLVQSYREAQKEQEKDEAEPEPEAEPETEDTQAEISAYFEQISLFTMLAEENRRWLQSHAVLHKFSEQECILTPEDEQEALWVLLNGKVKLYTKDKEDHDTLLDTLDPGHFFGGTSLFAPMRQNQERPPHDDVSARAEEVCIVLEIPKPILAALVKKEPDFSESLLMEHYKRKASDIALARVPLFSHLDPGERRKIAEHLTPMTARKGTAIITEGEIGDTMYVMKSGQVGVYTTLVEDEGVSVIKTDQERLHLATLQEGDFFGEQALITHEPRSATIIALTDVQLLKFTKQDLALVVKQYPRVGTLLKKYHQQRISDTLESLKSIW